MLVHDRERHGDGSAGGDVQVQQHCEDAAEQKTKRRAGIDHLNDDLPQRAHVFLFQPLLLALQTRLERLQHVAGCGGAEGFPARLLVGTCQQLLAEADAEQR